MTCIYHISALDQQRQGNVALTVLALELSTMAYDPGAIDATLAAAVGDEPALIADLREAFLEGVQRCLETMKSADNPDGWAAAALRLKGLSASFGAIRLMALASEAANGQAHDGAILRRLHRAVDRL